MSGLSSVERWPQITNCTSSYLSPTQHFSLQSSTELLNFIKRLSIQDLTAKPQQSNLGPFRRQSSQLITNNIQYGKNTQLTVTRCIRTKQTKCNKDTQSKTRKSGEVRLFTAHVGLLKNKHTLSSQESTRYLLRDAIPQQMPISTLFLTHLSIEQWARSTNTSCKAL